MREGIEGKVREGRQDQTIAGCSNIQVGRDVVFKVFGDPRSGRAEAIRTIDGYLAASYFLLLALLLGTMLPVTVLNILTSLGSVLCSAVIITLHLERYRISGVVPPAFRRFQVVAAALTILSITSGCAPLFSKDTDVSIIKTFHPEKTGMVQGVGVFGLGLDHITIEAAKQKGGVDKVIASQEIRGYGLISCARIRVYGQ